MSRAPSSATPRPLPLPCGRCSRCCSARCGGACSRRGRGAQERFLPRHRRRPVPRARREGGEGRRRALRPAAQRLRPLDHRGREPRLRRFHQAAPAGGAGAHLRRCPTRLRRKRIASPIESVLDTDMVETYVVGTGYGRARLPFSKEHIRSEILCHGLGAHVMYPDTATVLDIGGQDTKAIQVDEHGIVESFQMNDRCAAGCGRYLGYIADEMNMGLHELGPARDEGDQDGAHQLDLHGVRRRRAARPALARREARGHPGRAAPRDHPARDVDPRALGRHPQRVHLHRRRGEERGRGEALTRLVRENYGERDAQHLPDSIYTGALGAATFAWRAVVEERQDRGAEDGA